MTNVDSSNSRLVVAASPSGLSVRCVWCVVVLMRTIQFEENRLLCYRKTITPVSVNKTRDDAATSPAVTTPPVVTEAPRFVIQADMVSSGCAVSVERCTLMLCASPVDNMTGELRAVRLFDVNTGAHLADYVGSVAWPGSTYVEPSR
jgi:hypothetical protein